MTDVAAIVLAAGLSTRMGRPNKLLLSHAGKSLLRHMVETCAAVTCHPVTVVTGHERQLIERELAGLPVQFVYNRAFFDGQMTSVACGLNAAPKATATLLALGDQPLVTESAFLDLLRAHELSSAGRITIPVTGGKRGNPIVIPERLRNRMLSDPINLSCRKLTRTAPDLVYRYHTDDPGFYADIDTPNDYLGLQSEHLEQEEVHA